VFGVNVSADNLSWVSSVGTREFLVVEGNAEFEFVPTDGRCYDDQQAGCGSSPLTQLPAGVSILSIVKCVGECELGSVQSLPFQPIAGTKHFAIFGRNQIGRYAFGVAADTTGLTLDEGPALADADGVTPGGGMDADGPRVTVAASPLEGNSPLTVEFNWNAISALGIDTNRTQWIFDTGDPGGTTVTGPRRPTTFEYVVAPGQTKTFTAQLTMFDVAGNSGSVSVLIRVNGPSATGGGGGSNNVAILAGVPGSVGLDVDEGTSPFSVMFSIDATALDGSVQSIRWNLGDGNTASSFDALHTYENATDQDLVLAVTATVTFITPGGASDIASATRFVTVKPGTTTSGPIAPPDFGPTGSNGDSTACGAMGLLPLFAVPLGLTLLRCRRF
jgi:PKD repeat protein